MTIHPVGDKFFYVEIRTGMTKLLAILLTRLNADLILWVAGPMN
jgi:hypothetical protein